MTSWCITIFSYIIYSYHFTISTKGEQKKQHYQRHKTETNMRTNNCRKWGYSDRFWQTSLRWRDTKNSTFGGTLECRSPSHLLYIIQSRKWMALTWISSWDHHSALSRHQIFRKCSETSRYCLATQIWAFPSPTHLSWLNPSKSPLQGKLWDRLSHLDAWKCVLAP